MFNMGPQAQDQVRLLEIQQRIAGSPTNQSTISSLEHVGHVEDLFSLEEDSALAMHEYLHPTIWQSAPTPQPQKPASGHRALLSAAEAFLRTDGAAAGRVAKKTGKPFFFLLDKVRITALSVQDVFGEIRALQPAILSQQIARVALGPLMAVYVHGDFSKLHKLGNLNNLFSSPSRQLFTTCLLTASVAADADINDGAALFRTAIASACFGVGTLVDRHDGLGIALSFGSHASKQRMAFSLAAVPFATYRMAEALDYSLAYAPNPCDLPRGLCGNVVDVLSRQGDMVRLDKMVDRAIEHGDLAALWSLNTNISLQQHPNLIGRVQVQLNLWLGLA